MRLEFRDSLPRRASTHLYSWPASVGIVPNAPWDTAAHTTCCWMPCDAYRLFNSGYGRGDRSSGTLYLANISSPYHGRKRRDCANRTVGYSREYDLLLGAGRCLQRFQFWVQKRRQELRDKLPCRTLPHLLMAAAVNTTCCCLQCLQSFHLWVRIRTDLLIDGNDTGGQEQDHRQMILQRLSQSHLYSVSAAQPTLYFITAVPPTVCKVSAIFSASESAGSVGFVRGGHRVLLGLVRQASAEWAERCREP